MTVVRCAADVVAEHASFEVECIDRMYLNVYQPSLQYPAGLVGYAVRAVRLTEPKCGLVDCRPIVLGPPRIER